MAIDPLSSTGGTVPSNINKSSEQKTTTNKTTDKVAAVGDRSLTSDDREYLIEKIMKLTKVSYQEAKSQVDAF